MLATLIRLLGDFALAEEAMQEAYAAALQQWPEQGVPDNPSAWLIGVGQRRGIDQIRRRQRDAGTASLLHVAGFPVRAGLEKHLQQERLPDQVNVHMAFPGTCREAMQFYAEATGGHLEAMITFGETPFGETPAAKDVPPEWHDKIIHASLNLRGRRLMAADMAPECFSPPQGAEIHLEYHTMRLRPRRCSASSRAAAWC